MSAYTAHIYFLRIDSATPGEDPLRLSNAGFSPFPTGTEWGKYTPMGLLLRFDEIKSSVGLESNNIQVSIGATNTDIVRYCSNPENVQDNDVCIHHSIGTADDPDDDYALWVWSEPRIEFLGRIGNIEMNSEGVAANLYSASTDLSAITRTATKWSDSQHRQLVNATDYGFRYATRYGEEVNIITT